MKNNPGFVQFFSIEVTLSTEYARDWVGGFINQFNIRHKQITHHLFIAMGISYFQGLTHNQPIPQRTITLANITKETSQTISLSHSLSLPLSLSLSISLSLSLRWIIRGRISKHFSTSTNRNTIESLQESRVSSPRQGQHDKSKIVLHEKRSPQISSIGKFHPSSWHGLKNKPLYVVIFLVMNIHIKS